MAAKITKTTKTSAYFKGYDPSRAVGSEFVINKHGQVRLLRVYANGELVEGSYREPLAMVQVPAGTAPRTAEACQAWAVRLVDVYAMRSA